MAKTFLSKRTSAALAVMTDTIDHVRHDVRQAKNRNHRKSSMSLECQLIFGSLYYVVEDYKEAEPVLVTYVSAAKKEFGTNSIETFRGLWLLSEVWTGLDRIVEAMTAGAEAKSISMKINFSTNDPVAEALFRRAVAEKETKGLQGRQRAFVMALTALSLCVTGGLHRSSWGAEMLERLRLFFKSYGIDDTEWEWTVKHTHLTRYDFVGLLSILLHHTGLAPDRLEPVLRRKSRVIEVR